MTAQLLDELGQVFARAAVDGYLQDYERRANAHRPPHAETLAAEARRLHAQGFTALDISTALRIDSAQIREMLGTKEGVR